LIEAFFLGRARIVILMRDRVLGNGVVRECLHGFTRLSSTAASAAAPATTPPAPSTSVTFATLGTLLAFRFGYRREFGFFGRFTNFGYFFFGVFDRRQLRLLGGKAARCFRRVHLLTAVNYI
jgi:hypothetical protein